MSKEYTFCLRCGRKLKSPESKLRGYGSICYKKQLNLQQKNNLFSLQTTENSV